MAENVGRSTGRSRAYKLDAGGAPAESGPFIGEIMEHVPDTRSGKVKVYIEIFSGPDKSDRKLWRDVSYISPFFGSTAPDGPEFGFGSFTQNPHSYGMWFTPPDLGTEVVCFFANGDPNQGYYIGCRVKEDKHHMIPAVGASKNFIPPQDASAGYFANSTQVPVVEINDASEEVADTSRFFESSKPIHQVQAFALLQQGLLNDTVRGSIGTNSYRETPSTVFGITSPGRPIYQGGYGPSELQTLLNADANDPGTIPLESMKVIGREGGHSIVMDDGDLVGNDQLMRFRTAKGHQILLSDSGNTLHVIHANGQSWIELGAEGTVDVYAANSFNVRAGQINLHADAGININTEGGTNIRSAAAMNIESKALQLTGENSILAYSEKYVGIKSKGSIGLENDKAGTWDGGGKMVLSAGCIDLNGAKAPSVAQTTLAPLQQLPDVKFENNVGWVVEENKINSVATRVPTHEPWPFHQYGTSVQVSLDKDVPAVPLLASAEEKLDSVQDVDFDDMDVTDFEVQTPVEAQVGTLDSPKVTAMVAQASKNVPQEATAISNTLGAGKFGMNAEQLEKAGLLKSGTSKLFKSELDADFSTVLQSPSVWSGKDGVSGLDDFLSDEKLQDTTMANLYSSGLSDLKKTGLVTGLEAPDQLAGYVQASAKYPADTVKSWVQNKPLGGDVSSDIAKQVRSGQYSVQLTEQKISSAQQGYSTKTSTSTSTVTRNSVTTAEKQVITTGGASYTRTAQAPVSNTRTAELERQINYLTQVELPAAKTAWLNANPGLKFRDYLKSSEYKALVAKRESLQAQLEAARRG